ARPRRRHPLLRPRRGRGGAARAAGGHPARPRTGLRLAPLRAATGARYQHGMAHQEIPRDELHATLRARGEGGSELEPHLVDSFLDRIERSIDTRADARIEARLRAHDALRSPQQERNSGPAASTVVLALGSI